MPEGFADNLQTRLALGLDLGTSALKVVLIDEHGGVVSSAEAAIDTVSVLPGQAEQDVSQWLSATAQAVGALDASLPADTGRWREHLRIIGLAGQLPTLVVLGDHGPLGPAITWKDARADAAATAVVRDRRAALYRATGMLIDGRYLAPMFRHHWLARRSEVRRLLSAKDYLYYALTGREVTDPSTAAGYGLYDLSAGEFSHDLCALWDVPRDVLPDIRPAHSVAGLLSPAAAALLGLSPGLPVTVGAADSVSSAFAMGSLESPDRACVAMGSSTIILDAVREPHLDPLLRYLLTPHVESGWYAREMDLLATGTGHRWLSELFGWPSGALEGHAMHSPVGANDLIFAPYLAGGEQGALWNPALRGALQGLTLETTVGDVARAFMEGVAFEIRRCIEVLQEGQDVSEIVLAGHLAESRFGLQMLSNVLGRAVQPFPSVSSAALGAAFGALRSLSSNLRPRIQAAWPQPTTPGPERGEYERGYARYLRVSASCTS